MRKAAAVVGGIAALAVAGGALFLVLRPKRSELFATLGTPMSLPSSPGAPEWMAHETLLSGMRSGHLLAQARVRYSLVGRDDGADSLVIEWRELTDAAYAREELDAWRLDQAKTWEERAGDPDRACFVSPPLSNAGDGRHVDVVVGLVSGKNFVRFTRSYRGALVPAKPADARPVSRETIEAALAR